MVPKQTREIETGHGGTKEGRGKRKTLDGTQEFLENVQDLGILKKKAIVSDEDCPKNLVVNSDK